ncbi:hypothetical protein GGF37_000823 [Kickxella alabastrina]|nr:hypothetical protein GGF37_000823 [Kickxella alabastrina]
MELISKVDIEMDGNKYYSVNYRDDKNLWFNKTSDKPIDFQADISGGDRVDKDFLCPKYDGYRVADTIAGRYVKTPIYTYYKLEGSLKQCIRNEIETYERVSHPNICKYYGCVVEDGLVTGIVLEKLSKTLDRVDIDDPEALISQLIQAVSYIHSLGIVHGDINPYNIMVDDERLVLIDFDSVGAENGKQGTPGYMSSNYSKSMADDWYSVEQVSKFIHNVCKNHIR